MSINGCSSPTCTGLCTQQRQGFTDIEGVDMGATLAQRMIGVADRLRDRYTSLGLRPYKVRMVTERWSGGKRSVGVVQVIKSVDILPTPRVLSLDGLNSILNPGGNSEEGSITVNQISGCYTEDQLRGLGEGGFPIAKSDEFFWEIEYPQPNGKESVRRRFTVAGTPFYSAEKFGWSVRLERAIGDRRRDGAAR